MRLNYDRCTRGQGPSISTKVTLTYCVAFIPASKQSELKTQPSPRRVTDLHFLNNTAALFTHSLSNAVINLGKHLRTQDELNNF